MRKNVPVTLTEHVLQDGDTLVSTTDLKGRMTAAATGEQNRGVDQIGQAVSELDHTTAQNAALVEQGAAAAGSLKDQAVRLSQAVSVFRVGA